jgi:hypothetical protein
MLYVKFAFIHGFFAWQSTRITGHNFTSHTVIKQQTVLSGREASENDVAYLAVADLFSCRLCWEHLSVYCSLVTRSLHMVEKRINLLWSLSHEFS